MTHYLPKDPDFEARVRQSFARQEFLQTLGAKITELVPGRVEISAPFDRRFTQQDGFLHAGVVTTLIDSACGYAAHSLMPAGSRVLSVEFKVNLLAPAKGTDFLARGWVIKPGRTLTICNGELYAIEASGRSLLSAMQATMICLPEK